MICTEEDKTSLDSVVESEPTAEDSNGDSVSLKTNLEEIESPVRIDDLKEGDAPLSKNIQSNDHSTLSELPKEVEQESQ